MVILSRHYACYVILLRGETVDKHVVHAFETVVIEWAHQIQDVLKQKSDQQLVQGLHPDPLVELEFWKDRCANMEYIYEQVHCISVN